MNSEGTLLLTGAEVAALRTIDECMAKVKAGIKPGRTSSDEVIIFDSTGMALQDVVTAAAVYEKPVTEGIGKRIQFPQ